MTPMSSILRSAVFIAPFLAALPISAQDDASPYGVHSHVTRNDEHRFTEGEFDLMKQAGIKWLRTGFVWAAIMKKNGTFVYDNHDKVVAEAEKRGIRIMGLLHGAAGWAKPIHEHHAEWLQFVEKTVTRYKGRVPAWQVWNEPNIKGFWENPNPDHYAALLKPTYRKIKSVDPEARVVFGGNSQFDWNFMNRVLELAPDAFDIMAVHPYGYSLTKAPEAYIPGTVAEIRALMKIHGIKDRPIWFTEWGWPTHKGRSGLAEWDQANHIVRAHVLALTAGLERGFWYEFQATEKKDEDQEHHFGILHFDLKPKPAFKALETLIRMRPAGSRTLEGPYRQRLFYYPGWTTPDNKIVYAFWDSYGRWAKQRRQIVKYAGEVPKAYDLYGHPLELEVDPTKKTAVLLPEWGKPRYLVCTGRIAVSP
jgi:hypothetical protein